MFLPILEYQLSSELKQCDTDLHLFVSKIYDKTISMF